MTGPGRSPADEERDALRAAKGIGWGLILAGLTWAILAGMTWWATTL